MAEALKRYGMILADNRSDGYVSGTSDPRFDDDVMHELDEITGHDLEVVDTTWVRQRSLGRSNGRPPPRTATVAAHDGAGGAHH